ncbi:hypothetical protein EV359DRAFT_51930 [Lentinula novae-zelandiae]|nr:hypothetical protein EV359DRAFT_51930 [Lentinula novae-zelandiae]
MDFTDNTGANTTFNSEFNIEQNDVKIEYHPNSGKPTVIERFDIHTADHDHVPSKDSHLRPWLPFRTRMDFEVATLALECSMNDKQTEKLIMLLNHVQQGFDKCTLKDYKEVQDTWDLAAEKSTKFTQDVIHVPYRETINDFDVHFRPLWDWLQELLMDKDIPWTADRWWKLQDTLPANAVPLFIIFYADKNKLSSFGTAKGYPVVARLANLPTDIRNGVGEGGGRVVGWLPVVSEDSNRSNKTDFVNFKAIVWHESVLKILESLIEYSQTGYSMFCGDQIWRLIYPLLLLESSDYEEQCIMALIRGLHGLCPCPKCFVPNDKLSEPTNAELRMAAHAHEQLQIANAKPSKTEKEKILKKFSMRPQNVFMKLANGDPYAGSSFDDLHFQDSGLWGDHIFPLLKAHILALSTARDTSTLLDDRFKLFPRWRKLHHFPDGVFKITFNDGSKHRDISKVFLYIAYDLLREDNDKAGYELLKLTRTYVNVIMYSALENQTDETIAAGRLAINKMFTAIKVKYSKTDSNLDEAKSWNFIKLHYHQHLFDDIGEKGNLRSTSTRPNEKLHGPIRKIYLRRTNFKDVANQIVRIDHQCVVAGLIRSQLNVLDLLRCPEMDDIIPEDAEKPTRNSHFEIGSRLPAVTMGILEESERLFEHFSRRLSKFMSGLLRASDIELPGNQDIKYTKHDMVTPYQYLKVNYLSLDTWKVSVDYLRCNPFFNKEPRYDFVIFDSIDGPIFAQLRYIFTCTVGDHLYPIVLVQSYKAVSATRRSRSDKYHGLLRLQRDNSTEFISVRSIIRGAVVLRLSEQEAFVWDVLDNDMFLRVISSFPGYTSA